MLIMTLGAPGFPKICVSCVTLSFSGSQREALPAVAEAYTVVLSGSRVQLLFSRAVLVIWH